MGQTLVLKQKEVVHLRGWDFSPLTRELQEFYQELLEACFGLSDERRYRAYMSIQHDPTMVDMVKFMSRFIYDQVQAHAIYPNLRNMSILMKIVEHLIRNENIVQEIKQCLHEILPSVMTCIVCCTLSAAPIIEDHWKLRMSASELLAYICDNFASPVNRIKERAIKVLLTAIEDESKDLSTLYGGLFALKTLGFEAIKPHIPFIETVVKQRVERYTQAGQYDKNRNAALRIKDLISQISTMEATAASIPKVKAKIVNKDTPMESKTKTFGVPQPKRSHKKKIPPKPVVSLPVVSSTPVATTTKELQEDKTATKLESPPKPAIEQTSTVTPSSTSQQPTPQGSKAATSSAARPAPKASSAQKKSPELVTPAALFHTYHLKVTPRPRPLPPTSKSGRTPALLRPRGPKPVPIKRKNHISSGSGSSKSTVHQVTTKDQPAPPTTTATPTTTQSFITVTCPSTTISVPLVIPPLSVVDAEMEKRESLTSSGADQAPADSQPESLQQLSCQDNENISTQNEDLMEREAVKIPGVEQDKAPGGLVTSDQPTTSEVLPQKQSEDKQNEEVKHS